jgi:transcriptional regulator with XRE-family HTH domain
MKPLEIRIELMRAGMTQKDIADELKVSASMVSRVIDGKSASHRVRQQVAAAIGESVRQIWPEAYQEGAPRRPGRPSSDHTNNRSTDKPFFASGQENDKGFDCFLGRA